MIEVEKDGVTFEVPATINAAHRALHLAVSEAWDVLKEVRRGGKHSEFLKRFPKEQIPAGLPEGPGGQMVGPGVRVMTGTGGQRFLVKDPAVPGEKARIVTQLPPGTTAAGLAAGYNAARGVAQPRERGTETTTMNVHGVVS